MAFSQNSVVATAAIAEVTRRHNVSIVGDGEQTLVFGHGFGCNQDIWQHVAPAFFANYKVVLFDYIGCGKSDLSAYSFNIYNNLQAYADDLIAICSTLNLKNIHFVGHSVSGAIAMLASIKQPALFKKIISIGPSPRYLNDAPDYIGGFDAPDVAALLDMMERNYFEWTDYLAPIVIGNNQDPENVNELKQSFLKSDPDISRKFAAVTFYCDIRQQLADITVPVTILYCLEDVIVPEEVVHFLQNNIADCKIVELDASGHYPQLINPKAVIQAVEKEMRSASKH